jgi:hypothetical protein
MPYARVMRWSCLLALLCAVQPACGSRSQSGTSSSSGPNPGSLSNQVVTELWYTSPARCSQGPFVIDVSALGGRWGESVELMIGTPRRVRLAVEIVQDGKTVEQKTLTVEPDGRQSDAAPDNKRCVAGVLELDANMSGGTPASGSGSGPAGGHPVMIEPGSPGTEPGDAAGGISLTLRTGKRPERSPRIALGTSWWNDDPDRAAPLAAGGRIRIRLWSSVPNDLDDVYFLVVQAARTPDAGDEAYVAHVRAERQRVDKQRRQAEERNRQEMERRQREEMERRQREAANRPPPEPIDPAEAERRRRLAAEAAERERERRLKAERLMKKRERREAEARRREEEARRREAEALQRREAFCQAHKKDIGCWGPGGFTVHAELLRRKKEREAWCAAHPEEARCWSDRDWQVRTAHWSARIERARKDAAPPPEPTGPPPLPRQETEPPSPSENAEWRPGYWHWDGSVWHWIAGLWRVPETDIAQELTVKAPSEAPPPRAENPPPPPVQSAVWTAGYWQWDGSAWVWVEGSWQLPPDPLMQWKPPTWVPKGSVQVFVPGGWIKVRGR